MMWVKTGAKIVVGKGTTITYQLLGTPFTVESRKRPIPHANRSGSWDHTSYFVLKDGAELVERHTLRSAKEYAEALCAETPNDQGGNHGPDE